MDESPASQIDLGRIAEELSLTEEQVRNVAALLDEGNTVPFITRYRKERTGNLDEEKIRGVQKALRAERQLAERAATILRLIETQGKLTPALRKAILAARSLKRLEDLYLPFRPKRTSRALRARERGLAPLAEAVWSASADIADLPQAAAAFLSPENELPDAAAVLAGVSDILAERIGEDAEVRARCRRIAERTGRLQVSATPAGKESGQEYRDYFRFSEAVRSIPPHRVLAINRGEKAGALRVRFVWDTARALTELVIFLRLNDHPHGEFLQRCTEDAVSRLIGPALEREIRREMTDTAEQHAITVFARNLRNLLLQPPVKDCRILAIDPGFRTGCKVAVLDECGHCLADDVLYITGSQTKRAAAAEKLAQLLQQHGCQLVAIGNGTACRETEEIVAEVIQTRLPEVRYLIVNEAGASIYSTSAMARREFPDRDATVRGTISIGRRLLDPLSELVKIEPQHIGVGLYQHDLNSKRLKESLDEVVESCVNFVGVDLNTASPALLRYVSGFNQLIARRVVEWREQHGRFTTREQLKEVPGIGEATFTQAAGFLKIRDGGEILDATWIHPESYPATRELLKRLSLEPTDLLNGPSTVQTLQEKFAQIDREALAGELQIGCPTLDDIMEALLKPGRDPRADFAGPIFKQGILKLDDLQEGMELRGTVLNVVDFGAFVDVGLKESALVHISQMANRYIASPHDLFAVGDIVTVWVLGIDYERKRVSLTTLSPEQQRRRQEQTALRGRRKKRGKPPSPAGSPTAPALPVSSSASLSVTSISSTGKTISAETGTDAVPSAPDPAEIAPTVSVGSPAESATAATGPAVSLPSAEQSGLTENPPLTDDLPKTDET